MMTDDEIKAGFKQQYGHTMSDVDLAEFKRELKCFGIEDATTFKQGAELINAAIAAVVEHNLGGLMARGLGAV